MNAHLSSTRIVASCALTAIVAVLGYSTLVDDPEGPGDEPIGSTTPQPQAACPDLLPQLPASFVENRGQWDPRVRFSADRGAERIWVLDDGWKLAIQEDDPTAERARGFAFGIRFENALAVSPRGTGRQQGRRYWLRGADPSSWITDAAAYDALRWPALYQGVDVVLRETPGHFEYDLILEPGGDLESVMLRLEGAERLAVEADGTLVVESGDAVLRQSPPRTWTTDVDGRRTEVDCRYVLLGANRFGFAVDGWQAGTELTIDPGLEFATYLGGTDRDSVHALDVTPSGEIVATGNTRSMDFPVTSGAYEVNYHGHLGGRGLGDAFVAKLSADGTQLLFVTYLGGDQGESGECIHVDANGVITVSGDTSSTDFPTTSNALRRSLRGRDDLFVARLDATGAALLYGTYFGSGEDFMGSLVVDDSRDWIYLTGESTARSSFPTTPNAFRTSSAEAFLSILDLQSVPNTTVLHYSTMFGGTGPGYPGAHYRAHVGASGVVTIGGVTRSSNFPTTGGAFQMGARGSRCGVVLQIDPALSGPQGLLYSTHLGGSGSERTVYAATDDATGVITVAGDTSSSDFPVTTGAFQTTSNGASEVFVTRLDPAQAGAAQLLSSSYLGAAADDRVEGFHIDGRGIVTIAGTTSANLTHFPITTGAYATQPKSSNTSFVARFDPTQNGNAALLYSTFFGACHTTWIQTVHFDEGTDIATFGGITHSRGLPVRRDAAQRDHAGLGDGFIARLELRALPPATTTFGRSCAGTRGLPALVPVRAPELCTQYVLELQNALPSAPAGFLIGLSNQTWGTIALPLDLTPLGLPGCALRVSPDALLSTTTGAGTKTFSFAIPGEPFLLGGRFYNQLFFVDPGANTLGIVVTNGVDALIRS